MHICKQFGMRKDMHMMLSVNYHPHPGFDDDPGPGLDVGHALCLFATPACRRHPFSPARRGMGGDRAGIPCGNIVQHAADVLASHRPENPSAPWAVCVFILVQGPPYPKAIYQTPS